MRRDEEIVRAGITYRKMTRSDPRQLSLHVVKIDLKRHRDRLSVVLAPDPDGEGPAESALRSPLAAASAADCLVAINTHAFRVLAADTVPAAVKYTDGMAADLSGLAVVQGVVRSTPQKGCQAFWVDQAGRPHIGQPETLANLRLGVAGFQRLLRDGVVLPRAGGERHPRSAVGFDRAGTTLFFVAVDGRRPGHSLGMTAHELAVWMRELGCAEALNLDGGGSTCLMVTRPGQPLAIVNRPSDGSRWGLSVPRPVPVLLGVRRR